MRGELDESISGTDPTATRITVEEAQRFIGHNVDQVCETAASDKLKQIIGRATLDVISGMESPQGSDSLKARLDLFLPHTITALSSILTATQMSENPSRRGYQRMAKAILEYCQDKPDDAKWVSDENFVPGDGIPF
jgi:hypothetical protein